MVAQHLTIYSLINPLICNCLLLDVVSRMMGNYHIWFGEQFRGGLTLLFFMVIIQYNIFLTLIINSSQCINRKHCFKVSRPRNTYIVNEDMKETHEYTKIFIANAYYNRIKIASVAKNAIGVYIFTTPTGSCYVGSSKNLYKRVCSYFMPSSLAKSDRRVLRYFHKYGFKNVDLTLYIMDPKATSQMAIELEQYFIDILSPDLNVLTNILSNQLPRTYFFRQ